MMPSFCENARLTDASPTRRSWSSTRPSHGGITGSITARVRSGARAVTDSIACSIMNGAAAAHAWGMQATG